MKTSLATLALVLGLAVGLIGWFSTGYRAARSEDRARVSSLRQQTDARVADIAKQLREALRQLERVENSRPYYEFSNLFHDPRGASQGLAVAPSPLANGPTDPLVRAYFQVARQPSGGWQVSMPTINDDLPKLSKAASSDVALRADLTEVADNIVAAVAPVTPATPPVVAQVPTKRRTKRPPQKAPQQPPQQAPQQPPQQAPQQAPQQPPQQAPEQPPQQALAQANGNQEAQAQTDNIAQQIQLTPNQYQQNTNANQVYVQAQQQLPWQAPTNGPQSEAPILTTPSSSPLMVTVYAYEPKVLTVRGEPTLVALRRVVTPDGDLTQGMALNPAAIAEWLAERAPGAELTTATPTPTQAHAVLPWADNAWSIRVPYPSLAPAGETRV
nr:hypothetical protein [Kofleriaceae bacterium]